MKKLIMCVAVLALVAPVMAAPELRISIGLRETGFAGGTDVGVGNNGGASGGIEFCNLDGATLVLDGTWQQFSFTLSTATYAAFAGASANGVLEGAYGTLEHIRIREGIGGITGPITLWTDDVMDTYDPAGPAPPISTLLGAGFETRAPGTGCLFREPRYSGSTSTNLLASPNISTVDGSVAYAGTNGYRSEFQFVDNTDTRWLRYTTNAAAAFPNPLVRFDQSSVISFWMMGIPEPTSLALLGGCALTVIARRRASR